MAAPARPLTADPNDPLTIARDVVDAVRDCGICGGAGKLPEHKNAECGGCGGGGKVYVYGPNVRVLAEEYLRLAKDFHRLFDDRVQARGQP
jgi:hypothetical protein